MCLLVSLRQAVRQSLDTDHTIDPASTDQPASNSEQTLEPEQELQQHGSLRVPIGDEEQANPRRDANPRVHAQAPPSDINSHTRKASTRLDKVCIIRDTSGDSSNILLNCHPPAKSGELWVFAAFGTILQLGVLAYSWFATYHSSLKLLKDDKPIERYAYPCTAIGTLVLVSGMFLCSYVVESSTVEKRYEATEEWKTRIVWLQQAKTVSDQFFDSCMVYSKDDRRTITTSRRIQRKSKSRSTGSDNGASLADNDEPSAILQLVTISGTAVALCGFILQFVGLRGMHWSASIAQLGAVLVMVGVRVWVRRGLAKSPACEPLPSGFELDSFAKTLGHIHKEAWSGGNKTSEAGNFCKNWNIVTG